MPPQQTSPQLAVLEAARQTSQRLICHALNRQKSRQFESLSARDITPDHSKDVKALVQVTTAAVVACEAAAALQLLAKQQTHSTTKTLPLENRHVAAAAEAKRWVQEAEQLLQLCQDAAAHRTAQSKQYASAVKEQRDVLERAFERRQAEYLAAIEAARRQKFMSRRAPLLQAKSTHETSNTWLSTYLSRLERGRQCSAAADRKPLPAAVYYSIMGAMAQHRQDLQQLQMDQHLKQLQERLREDPAKAVAAHHTKAQHKCTALHRLSNLCSMMQHGIAPYHLAMGPHELALAVLESLPWLWRSRSHLQLFEQAETRMLLQQWMQHKQRASSSMTSSAKASLIATTSRSARRQLLRSYARYILAADDSQEHVGRSSSHSEAAPSSTWKGISWALFPDGLQRELHSLTDRWRSCPDASVMAKQQQLRADSATASYMAEVRSYTTSPYPSFEDMLREEVQSSISTHNLQRIMTGGRARSSPAAAAGYVAARRRVRA